MARKRKKELTPEQELRRAYLIEKMSLLPLEELEYALGRYCGPHNVILAEKKYGHALPKDVVEEAIKIKQFEEALFGSDS